MTTIRRKNTKFQRLFNRLLTGKNLTKAEAKKKFGVRRLAARVHELRNDGFTIYTNEVKVGNKRVTAYRLDTKRLNRSKLPRFV